MRKTKTRIRREVIFTSTSAAEPYQVSVAERGDAAALYFQLETGTFEACEFYSFLDIDGEEVAVCLKDVIVVEFKKEILNEGVEEFGEGRVELDEF